MPFEEVVEAEGHLIDSHVMEQIFDKVVESNGRFEVEQFRIGRTNGDPSYLRLRVETPTRQQMEHVLAQLLAIGCSPAETRRRRAGAGRARPLRAGRFLFHQQSPHLRAHQRRIRRSAEPAHGRDDRRQRRGYEEPRSILPAPARSESRATWW